MGNRRVGILARYRGRLLDILQGHGAKVLERNLAPYLLRGRARGYSLILADKLKKVNI